MTHTVIRAVLFSLTFAATFYVLASSVYLLTFEGARIAIHAVCLIASAGLTILFILVTGVANHSGAQRSNESLVRGTRSPFLRLLAQILHCVSIVAWLATLAYAVIRPLLILHGEQHGMYLVALGCGLFCLMSTSYLLSLSQCNRTEPIKQNSSSRFLTCNNNPSEMSFKCLESTHTDRGSTYRDMPSPHIVSAPTYRESDFGDEVNLLPPPPVRAIFPPPIPKRYRSLRIPSPVSSTTLEEKRYTGMSTVSVGRTVGVYTNLHDGLGIEQPVRQPCMRKWLLMPPQPARISRSSSVYSCSTSGE
ncbi:hypothetical protein K470DRAFT_93097 [Piedraia hortae CBS 480.64]|uniref:Uncharacterized protein n=1 Tax=Piedraia hortae CBS 480.64 TaxID=1314780 RepID=A0A6A7BYI6_9PEZI|nr:hypothetical protein K470DRAFT_93097 [Piedraia hortae CBS 480.64]